MFSVKRVMFGLFGLQILFAGVLMSRDFAAALPHIAWPSTRPSLESPVLPGDQTRRFRPRDTPLFPNSPTQPFRNTNEMPQRLVFEKQIDVLKVTGAIAPGDSERFEEFLEGARGLKQVRLNSAGGSVHDALAIGRTLRDAGLNVTMQSNDLCFSACPCG